MISLSGWTKTSPEKNDIQSLYLRKQYSFKELPPREKSQRIQKIAEKERLRLSTDNAFNRKGGLMNSPSWFGSTVPANPKEDELFKSTPVPKFDLGVHQVLELTRDIIQLLIFCT